MLSPPHNAESSSGRGGSITDPTITSTADSACDRLIAHEYDPDELPGLIEAIYQVMGKNAASYRLPLKKAKIFVEATAEVLDRHDLPVCSRKKCLRLLYRTCSHHGIMPRALMVEANRSGGSLYRGGYADVWKGERRGQEVAVKVLRVYSNDELREVTRKFCKEAVVWRYLRHPNVLPLIGVMMEKELFAMVSRWVANETIIKFVKNNQNVDKIKLLVGVAEGLIYLHEHDVVHGDLKGVNILVNESGHALLADFGLVQIMSDNANGISSSDAKGGTHRWMSPELHDPKKFGFEKFKLTERSDCYALGMVIYEIIGGVKPFHKDQDAQVFLRVSRGEHPERMGEFSEPLWKMTKRCWTSKPADRPDIREVLECLKAVSNTSGHPSPQRGGEMKTGGGPPSGSPAAQNGTSATTARGTWETYQRKVVRVTVLKTKNCDKRGSSLKQAYVTLRSGDEEHKTSRRPEQMDTGCGWPNEQITFKATSDQQKIRAQLRQHTLFPWNRSLGSGEIDVWRYLNPTEGVFSTAVLLRFNKGHGALKLQLDCS